MMKLLIPLTLVIISCSNVEVKRKAAWKAWEGKSTEELKKHAYFKNLKRNKIQHKHDIETWIYKDQTPLQTSAYCQSLGGCQAMPIYNCSNAFSVKDKVIIGFEQQGTCPDPRVIRPE